MQRADKRRERARVQMWLFFGAVAVFPVWWMGSHSVGYALALCWAAIVGGIIGEAIRSGAS